MKNFPTNADYVEALQHTHTCFRDPELKSSSVEQTKLGMPRAISGNFASVFTATGSSGKRYAVKCFTREVTGQDKRYKAIHDHLARMGRPWQVGFDYISQGVLVKGEWHPIVRMEWIEQSHTLIPWLERNLYRPDLILDLASQFAACIKDLQRAGIAHGDLQHGNLLVDANNRLRLIDYDGMFVPSIRHLGANELGHANYQHPLRSSSDFGPYLDRFSAWLIYGSLLSLAAHPSLWSTFRKDGDEKLLLGKHDFVAPLAAIQRLASNGSPEREFEKILNSALTSTSLAEVPEFDLGRMTVPTHIQAMPKPGAWWESQSPRGTKSAATLASPRAGTTRLGASWLSTHEERRPPPIAIVGPPPASKLVGLVVTLAAILGFGTAVTASNATFGGLILLMWATTITGGVLTLWRRSDAVVERNAARREFNTTTSELARQKKLLKEERVRRDELDERERNALEPLEKKLSNWSQSSISEYDRQNQHLKKKLSSLQTDLANLDAAKAMESARQLKALQDQHVQTSLAARQIKAGVIPGVGPALVASLAHHGIRSAADLDAVNGTQLRRTGSTSWVTLAGLSRGQSAAISRWHKRQCSAASRGAPRSLPDADRQAIDTTFQNQKNHLQGTVDALTAQLGSLKGTIDAKYAARGQGIPQRVAAIRHDFQSQRTVIDARIAQAIIEIQNLEKARRDARRNLERFRNLSLESYLKA